MQINFSHRMYSIALLLLASLFAGCGPKEETPEPKPTKGVDGGDAAATGAEALRVPPLSSPNARTGSGTEGTQPEESNSRPPISEEDTAPGQLSSDPEASPVVVEEPLTPEEKAAIEEAKQTVVPPLPRPSVPPVFRSLGKALLKGAAPGRVEEPGTEDAAPDAEGSQN